MHKIQKHIEIVRSTNTQLSSLSKVSCDAIYAILKRNYKTVGITTVNNLADLKRLALKRPDLAFIGMKFVPMNESMGLNDPVKIWVTEFLEKYGIACTGSEPGAHELEQAKHLAKQCIQNAGLATSPFYLADCNKRIVGDDMTLAFPIFVKPNNRGGGMGIDSDSLTHNFDQLQLKVKSISDSLQADSLLEEYLPGREFSVGVIKDNYSDELTAMPIEMLPAADENGERILSHKLKSAALETPIGPVADPELRTLLTDLAIGVFQALGARDYGRIDIRLDAKGIPHFLEANLIPGLIRGSGNFPKACALNIGMDHETMILHIVRLALARCRVNSASVLQLAVAQPIVR